MYEKNQRITLTIEDLGTDGEGIGHIEGFAFFVKDAVPGDVIEAKVIKSKKNYAYARLEKVITPSPFRVVPKCGVYRACGGCQIQALSYEKQLELKEKKVLGNLKRIGGFSPEEIERVAQPIVGMENPWRYRNKAQYPVGVGKDGSPIAGFYAGHSHDIMAAEDCFLGREIHREILDCVLSHMKKYEIPAYDEKTGKGLVRHILIREGFTSGEIMVCLVLNRKPSDKMKARMVVGSSKKDKLSGLAAGSCAGKEDVGDALVEYDFLREQGEFLENLGKISNMTSVSVNLNPENTNVILGRETYCIWGQSYISDTIHVRDMKTEGFPFTGQELTFHISPQSFYQVNPVQTEKLYSLALEYADLHGEETVWDLYCGIGTISLFLSLGAKEVRGVEIVPQAIEDAKANALRNGRGNAVFSVGKAEEVLPAFYKEANSEGKSQGSGPDCGDEQDNAKRQEGFGDKDSAGDFLHPQVIVVDPPRKGCDEACLNTMLQMKPDRIVYVSCDSATLARDLRILCDGGYELKIVRPVDMFPHTVHVETCCLLVREQIKDDDLISIKVDLEGISLEQGKYVPEEKPTYGNVKKWIKEKYGFNVTNLYIGQIKDKLGLEKRKNYNVGSGEGRVPNCPQEKEEAIIEAFKHFGLI